MLYFDARARLSSGPDDTGERHRCVLHGQVDVAAITGDRFHRPKTTKRSRSRLKVAGAFKVHPIGLAGEHQQFVAGALGLHHTVVQDADAVAQPLGLLHVVGGVQHGHPRNGQRFNRFQDRIA